MIKDAANDEQFNNPAKSLSMKFDLLDLIIKILSKPKSEAGIKAQVRQVRKTLREQGFKKAAIDSYIKAALDRI